MHQFLLLCCFLKVYLGKYPDNTEVKGQGWESSFKYFKCIIDKFSTWNSDTKAVFHKCSMK